MDCNSLKLAFISSKLVSNLVGNVPSCGTVLFPLHSVYVTVSLWKLLLMSSTVEELKFTKISMGVRSAGVMAMVSKCLPFE